MDQIELIKKFLRNECSREEEILIDRILMENPDLVDEQLNAKEWDKAEVLSGKSDQLKDEIWAGVYAATRPRKKIIQLWKPLSLAASLVLVLGLIYFRLPSGDKNHGDITNSQLALKTASNKTTGYLKFSMPDGSIITLSPGAAISYPENFGSNRKIFLKTGKAAFEIAKDKVHPFTVWAKNIATTALGTKFTVAELKSGVDVKLYEGKVVVDAFDQKSKKRSDFLKPGQRYTTSLDKKTQRLSTFSGDFDGAIDKRLGVISNLVPGLWLRV
ncbi:FecR domain-containing protein [Pedobacter riviphilus]|uniref:FecR domain-containing protein n=1 Tax=Pedobacter riviphilus TaxID=2766984 RepID=A0ABX6TLY9_9SPHI|nr:FecR family protein [Pedobacter riviphilus]QNR85931.1 FecR domain-containing protein [Pedobacter riviphilus]